MNVQTAHKLHTIGQGPSPKPRTPGTDPPSSPFAGMSSGTVRMLPQIVRILSMRAARERRHSLARGQARPGRCPGPSGPGRTLDCSIVCFTTPATRRTCVIMLAMPSTTAAQGMRRCVAARVSGRVVLRASVQLFWWCCAAPIGMLPVSTQAMSPASPHLKLKQARSTRVRLFSA